jgi:hypothetical protein
MKRTVLLVLTVGLLLPAAAWGQTKGPAMKFPSPDAERLPSWTPLGKYIADKGLPGDPVAEASKALVGGAATAFRPTPATYQKMTTPDPFENRHGLRVPTVVPEEPAPPLLLPRK